MKGYTTRDVDNLIGLSERQSRQYGRSGILDPARGANNRYLFSFQDLVLLRTAKELLDARMSPAPDPAGAPPSRSSSPPTAA
jgi:DNA-binding transcriptional MerR regulator